MMADEPDKPEPKPVSDSAGASPPIEPGPLTPNRDRKRQPPVIDLKADPIADVPRVGVPPEDIGPLPGPVVGDAIAADKPLKDETLGTETFGSEPPRDKRQAGPPSAASPQRSRLPLVTAVLALLIIAAIGAGAYYLIDQHDRETAALQAQISALQAQAGDLSSRLATMAPAAGLPPLDKRIGALETLPMAVSRLDARLDSVEKRPLPTPVAPPAPAIVANVTIDRRIRALETQADAMKAMAEEAGRKADAAREDALKVLGAVATAAKTSPPVPIVVPPSVDLSPLDTRIGKAEAAIAGLDRSLAAARDDIHALQERPMPAPPPQLPGAGLALATQALREAFDAGQPFAPALAALKTLGTGDDKIAALQPFAAAGAPTPAALRQEFAGLSGAIAASLNPKTADNGGFFGRLAEGASGLMDVQAVGQTPGDDPSATLAAIRTALDQGDLAAADAAWSRLPPPAQAVSKSWEDRLAARRKAEAAVHALTGDAVAALGTAKP